MNSLDFLEAVGDIDDSFVFEVEALKKRKRITKSILFVMEGAACLALLIGLGSSWQSNRKNPNAKAPNHVKYEKERGIDENAVISEKQKREGKENNSDLAGQNQEMPSNEIMENIAVFAASNEMPDWFGDYYLENDTVYVLLVENNETNQAQVKKWLKSENIVFKKADFSLNYLNQVIENIFVDMDKGKIDFIDTMTLDSRANRIRIETTRDISGREKESLYGYDERGEGIALMIERKSTDTSDAEKEDLGTINKGKEQLSFSEPTAKVDSKIIMNVKNNNNVLAIKIENKSSHKIFFGGEYALYRRRNNELERIEYLPGVGVHDLAYELKKDGRYIDEIKLSDTFGELESGKYILKKELRLKNHKVVVSAEFEMK